MKLFSNKADKKNLRGFSLVELIVVLVIMAILTAALVPSLIGYIRQARQSTAKDECASVVQACQTIISSAYVNTDGVYHSNTEGVDDVEFDFSSETGSFDQKGKNAAEYLSEVEGSIGTVKWTDGLITEVTYTSSNGEFVTYTNPSSGDAVYEIGSQAETSK